MWGLEVGESPYIVVGDLKRVEYREVVVFDLDGVIVDSSERYRLSLAEVDPNAKSHVDLPKDKRSQFWRVFLSEKYMDYDKPVPEAIEMLRRCREKGYPIVIVTGRTSNMLDKTLEQLKSFGIEYDVLVMRHLGVYVKDHEFKEHVVKSMNLQIAEVHDDSVAVIDALHKYAARGSFLWFKPGWYIYAPPAVVFINRWRYVIEDSVEALRRMIEGVEASPELEAEIRYGGYRATLDKRYARAFIEALFSCLSKKLCYPECSWVVESEPFFHLLELAALDYEAKGDAKKVRIFGEEHPSYVSINFDKMFSDPKKVAESWISLKESGILSEEEELSL